MLNSKIKTKIIENHSEFFEWANSCQGCGVGSPVIRLRLLAISIIRLQLRLRLWTDSNLQLY